MKFAPLGFPSHEYLRNDFFMDLIVLIILASVDYVKWKIFGHKKFRDLLISVVEHEHFSWSVRLKRSEISFFSRFQGVSEMYHPLDPIAWFYAVFDKNCPK